MAKLQNGTISNRMVAALKVERDTMVWDRALTGFGVRAYPSGGVCSDNQDEKVPSIKVRSRCRAPGEGGRSPTEPGAAAGRESRGDRKWAG